MASLYPNYQYLVLDSTNAPVVTSTSWQVADGLVKINGQNVCRFKDLVNGSVTDSVAEVLQETKLTFAATSNSVYQFVIQQFNAFTGKTMVQTFTYTSDATATATEVYDYFKAAVDAAVAAGQLYLTTTTSVNPDLILKGVTGYPQFTVTVIQQPSSGITLTFTTAGVIAVGTTAALALKGITVPAGKTYQSVHIEYNSFSGQNVKDPSAVFSQYDLYLDKADGDTAALATVITNNLNGLDNAGAVANPQAIAVI